VNHSTPRSQAATAGRLQTRKRPDAAPGPRDRDAGPEAGDGPDADPENVARAICLRQLTLGPRTKAELARAMAHRHVPEPVAQAVLQRLEDVGLVDDAAFAAAWVDSRQAGRGLGRRALAHELRRRGVAEPVAKEALDGLDPEQELLAAHRLVAGRLGALRGLDAATQARRLGGLLARKGYSPGLAYRVVREALGDTDGGFDDAP
jgi:regulatory protein